MAVLSRYVISCVPAFDVGRAAEAQYVQDRDAAMIADSWESVCKLVDLKEKDNKEKDTSRMRGLLVQLKHVTS